MKKLNEDAVQFIKRRIAETNPSRKELILELKNLGYSVTAYKLNRFIDRNQIDKPNKRNNKAGRSKYGAIKLLDLMKLTEQDLFKMSNDKLKAHANKLVKFYYNKKGCFTAENAIHCNLYTPNMVYGKLLMVTSYMATRNSH